MSRRRDGRTRWLDSLWIGAPPPPRVIHLSRSRRLMRWLYGFAPALVPLAALVLIGLWRTWR
jgi:hypothetical protein